MINVSTITAQIVDHLKDQQALSGFTITRSEFVNEDPGRGVNGWIGVYRRSVDYDPRNLGISPDNYHGQVQFQIIVQRTSLKSGEDCEDVLEDSVKDVLDALVQIKRLYIDHFSDLIVEYTYLETERDTMYFQGALITVQAEVSFEVE